MPMINIPSSIMIAKLQPLFELIKPRSSLYRSPSQIRIGGCFVATNCALGNFPGECGGCGDFVVFMQGLGKLQMQALVWWFLFKRWGKIEEVLIVLEIKLDLLPSKIQVDPKVIFLHCPEVQANCLVWLPRYQVIYQRRSVNEPQRSLCVQSPD